MDNKDNKNRMTEKIIKSNKIPITIIENSSKEDIIWLKLKKSIVGLFKEGKIYKIHIKTIEELDKKLYNNLLKIIKWNKFIIK